MTYGFNELPTSWNAAASHDNSVYNLNPQYLTQAQGSYYDPELNLINNDSFIVCKKVSDDPLTISYTINAAAKWSDGVPVTADDLLLVWIAQSGKFNTADAAYDADGNLLPSKGVSFDAASPGLALVTDFPKISDDNKTMTLVYSKPFVDYNLNITGAGLAAHAVAMKALGLTDATAATAALVKAAKDDDKVALKKIADTWNTGYDFTALPGDKSLYLSNGAYLMTDFKEGQFITFEANPDYTWGPKPSVKTITIQYAPDPTAAVQSLANGELQLINPQATEDVLKGLEPLKGQGVETLTGDGGTYEHVDLVFDNGGPFDPKTYGGDAAKALAVRQAFLKTIPRQDIVDRLIKPLNPNAALRESFNLVPGSPNYDGMVAANGLKDYDKVDIAGAKALLAQAGATLPVSVRFLYADNNPRRANEYSLIAESAKKAGFTVVDGKNAKWSSLLPNTKIYDASMFGWASTSTGVSQVPPNFLGKVGGKWVGQNNYGHYNNEQVTGYLNELNITTDPAKQLDLLTKTETALVKDAFGTVIFQFPDVVAWDSTKLTGVKQMSLSPDPLGNYWEWKVTG